MFRFILLGIRGFLVRITSHKNFSSSTYKVENMETVFNKNSI